MHLGSLGTWEFWEFGISNWYASFKIALDMALGLFLWMGFNCLKAAEPLRGGSLLFNIKFSKILGTRLISFGRMKDWVDLGVIQWFWTWTPGLGIQRLNHQAIAPWSSWLDKSTTSIFGTSLFSLKV